ncbi:hypothetical protein [Leisingera sp. ANG-M6]|nr:hypothetical protein [Leisingera sp. ANG-M6]
MSEEGGRICPVFNEFVEGVCGEVQGWQADRQREAINGLPLYKHCLA